MRLPPELSANCVCGYGHRGITGTATGALRGSREVLPRSRGPANESTRGDGSQRASALVRATTGRTEHRVVDRGRHRDRQEAERKQKTDRQDAQHILHLLLKDDFPQIWVPSWENRDLRQLLWHRHRMVQARTRIMNQLQAVALNEGLRCKKRLWREKGREQLESFRLAPWASRRRRDLLGLLDRLTPRIAELTQAVEQEAEQCPEARRLRTHPGGWFSDGAGIRTEHRESGTVSVWQADRELSGTGAVGGVQRAAATAGTHHETGQLAVAFPAGGGGASHGAERPGMAQPVFSPGDA